MKKICYYYHLAFMICFLVGGHGWIVYDFVKDLGFSVGAITGLLVCSIFTLAFPILPIFIIALSFIARFAPIMAIPLLALRVFGIIVGVEGLMLPEEFAILSSLSIFGAWNLYSAIQGSRYEEGEFSVVSLLPKLL